MMKPNLDVIALAAFLAACFALQPSLTAGQNNLLRVVHVETPCATTIGIANVSGDLMHLIATSCASVHAEPVRWLEAAANRLY